MACLQEYDLEFKPAHTIKGQGLCQIAAEAASSHGIEEECWEQEIGMYQSDHVPQQSSSSWYSDISRYLAQGTMDPALKARHKRAIRLKAATHQLIRGKLFKKHYDGVLLRRLENDEA